MPIYGRETSVSSHLSHANSHRTSPQSPWWSIPLFQIRPPKWGFAVREELVLFLAASKMFAFRHPYPRRSRFPGRDVPCPRFLLSFLWCFRWRMKFLRVHCDHQEHSVSSSWRVSLDYSQLFSQDKDNPWCWWAKHFRDPTVQNVSEQQSGKRNFEKRLPLLQWLLIAFDPKGASGFCWGRSWWLEVPYQRWFGEIAKILE